MRFLFKLSAFLLLVQSSGVFAVIGTPALSMTCPRGGWYCVVSDGGFELVDFGTKKKEKITENTLFITRTKRGIAINGIMRSSLALQIIPCNKTLTVNGISYTGYAKVSLQGKRAMLEVVGNQSAPYAQLVQSDATHEREDKQEQIVQLDELAQNTKITEVAEAGKHMRVRVLLDDAREDQVWHFSCEHGFTVHEQSNPRAKKPAVADILVARTNSVLYINGKKYKHGSYVIKPLDSVSNLGGRTYHGVYLIKHDAKQTLMINGVDLEDYIYSVLRTESWPGWPLEVNKVFAIASRSYVIAMAMRARRAKQAYHIKNTNHHQTYTGVHADPILKEAVEQTRGVYLAYRKQPILAMFDCCCGGVIPADISGVNFEDAPYLSRKYKCEHCQRCRLYSWQKEFKMADFERALAKLSSVRGTIKDVKVTKKDKAGLVKQVVIKKGKETITLSGQQFYSLFKDIKSFCFNVNKKKDRIVVKGYGLGHHLGLCQWGAREMVRDGWDYQRILQFYYPGAEFRKTT